MSERILVLGGGPAGAVTAIALRNLGYQVSLVSQPRPFHAVEGISERVYGAMKAAGLVTALQYIQPPSPRRVSWNGVSSAANTERLIERRQFDKGLQEDLLACGVQVIEGRVQHHLVLPDKVRVNVSTGTDNGSDNNAGNDSDKNSGHGQFYLEGDFLVEARGRAAPASGLERLKGCNTLALLQRWYGPATTACSAVESFPLGWAWMAALPSGMRYLQLMVDADHTQLPPKAELAYWCQQQLQQIPAAGKFMQHAKPIGAIQARTAGQVLNQDLIGERYLRIGDAAMAVDPLSGNGIFQSMSSALQAPAVINTLLRQPANGHLAKDFYRQRIEQLFYRFSRTGRDFCRTEEQWPQQPFWQQRRVWPDLQPLHQTTTPEQLQICLRPVVDKQLIRLAEVVITPDQPLGFWHLDGVELAPLLRQLQPQPADLQGTLALLQQLTPAGTNIRQLLGWMISQGWIAEPSKALA
ncbi:flavin-dependent monooxygenase QhpG [Oceanobacter mangrovi]|uniref:flavin-dependent monooxygenase QhpG n=1 Tax=Oceanobacter mangrovi TaxID=2862510 RepID=UPI001C8D4CF9|nr:FAD-dependent oxidoreductase [Oceanobacter mangrovi]